MCKSHSKATHKTAKIFSSRQGPSLLYPRPLRWWKSANLTTLCWNNSIQRWNITMSGLEEQTSAILKFFFCFWLWPHPVIGMLFCISLPNVIQIGPSAAQQWRRIDFKYSRRCGLMPLPVSLTSLSSEGQNLSASQIWSTWLNSRLRYNYFHLGKTNIRHIGILIPVSRGIKLPKFIHI